MPTEGPESNPSPIEAIRAQLAGVYFEGTLGALVVKFEEGDEAGFVIDQSPVDTLRVSFDLGWLEMVPDEAYSNVPTVMKVAVRKGGDGLANYQLAPESLRSWIGDRYAGPEEPELERNIALGNIKSFLTS